ncbi:hypothetical protein F5Y16DRAFT_399562 [Xylariaceae sp. FL0255]|nr:hypothetical protein F5Y16DRAFT_399562 [Xylariaceae sp. FL0255]
MVAFAYPPSPAGQDPDPANPKDQILETIPVGEAQSRASNLIHGDLHWVNIMFGELETSEESGAQQAVGEHKRVPIAKAIDFGFAAEPEAYQSIMPPTAVGMDFEATLGLAAIKKTE